MHDVHNNKVPSGILSLFQKNKYLPLLQYKSIGNFHVNSSDLEL